jgi:hypothetical protein
MTDGDATPPRSSADLWRALEEFRQELEAAGLRPNTVETYVSRTAVFLRWLDGDYTPQGPSQTFDH